jgi:hypothetical protein
LETEVYWSRGVGRKNGGAHRFSLNFCFFFFKKKEGRKKEVTGKI